MNRKRVAALAVALVAALLIVGNVLPSAGAGATTHRH
jgi:hypothetical protein